MIAVMNFRVPLNAGNFLTSWGTFSFSGRLRLLGGVWLLPQSYFIHLPPMFLALTALKCETSFCLRRYEEIFDLLCGSSHKALRETFAVGPYLTCWQSQEVGCSHASGWCSRQLTRKGCKIWSPGGGALVPISHLSYSSLDGEFGARPFDPLNRPAAR